MNIHELYLNCKRKLTAAGIDSPEFDAAALIFHFFSLDRTGLSLHGDKEATPSQEAAFLRAAKERAERRPLQYILGSWEFMKLSLKVGEGVLVPREDTAVLVEELASHLDHTKTNTGLDLCAGSGAVGLALCSLLPGTELTCVELSPQALVFLRENLSAYDYHISALAGDILSGETQSFFLPESLDFIASNPPYIESSAIHSLQSEVQKEPSLALDGGADGLLFYRAIAEHWFPKLRCGGIIAVEIGETQAKAVSELFSSYGVQNLQIHKDFSGLDRAVSGCRARGICNK